MTLIVFSNSEANDFAIPYIKSLNLPKTKIKILDIGHEYYSKLLEGDKFIYTKNNIDLRETFIPKIRGKNFCHLLGDLSLVSFTKMVNGMNKFLTLII